MTKALVFHVNDREGNPLKGLQQTFTGRSVGELLLIFRMQAG
jgi:hypothetical protein